MSMRLPNSCFVHIPRTGGLWFKEVVHVLGIKNQVFTGDVDSHFTFHEMPEFWQTLQPFSFIRHPLSWIRSRWSHSREHHLKEDYRHYRVHRLFDQLVRPTFQETVESILRDLPGIVSLTFFTMLDGVPQENLRRTEELPMSAFDILQKLEGLPSSRWEEVRKVEKFNSTSSLNKYKNDLEGLPENIVNEFLSSESQSLELWNQVGQREICHA